MTVEAVSLRCEQCKGIQLSERFAVVLPNPDATDAMHIIALVCEDCGHFEIDVSITTTVKPDSTRFLPRLDQASGRFWYRCARCGGAPISFTETWDVRVDEGRSRLTWMEGHCACCGRPFTSVVYTLPDLAALSRLTRKWRDIPDDQPSD